MSRKSRREGKIERPQEPWMKELYEFIGEDDQSIAEHNKAADEHLTQQFGQVMKRIRQQKGLSIHELAEQTKLSASYLYQIERGIRRLPSLNAILSLSEVYDVPLPSLMAAARYVEPEEVVLYHDELERAFRFVCQDKRFKYSPLVDEAAVPEDVKRFVVEMYQHFTGVKLLERVNNQKRRDLRMQSVLISGREAKENLPAPSTSDDAS